MSEAVKGQLLTNEDAAEFLGVSHTTLEKWISAGLIKRTQLPLSTRKRIKRETLEEFLKTLKEI